MIELPEAMVLAKNLEDEAAGRTVKEVCPPSYVHKFCWFNGEPSEYGNKLNGVKLEKTEAFGSYVEMVFDNDIRLTVNDGVNIRLLEPCAPRPVKYQLLIEFEDGFGLAFTVAMYGAIYCHTGNFYNEYYEKNKYGLSLFDEKFDDIFMELLNSVKQNMSAKAFLATEQRIPGLGNGSLQDILLHAGIHPKRKVGTLSDGEKEKLLEAVKGIMDKMIRQGGRNTERNLYGEPGGYQTLLSKITYQSGCPYCGGDITKMAYLGGTVYFCPRCQPEKKD
ncbi:endonuclease VIII [Clostridium sp. MCC353]|uniref:endonuclease VIII n=1 Tax=Clostridium sp. MCC353 TaxID=2592646 RepID=UPI001C0134C0|nr:endonuclease VIII [Clostridium sp. MCC353]MBT9775038.1 endonuclease VIII [Clostridium sp. MCC353]